MNIILLLVLTTNALNLHDIFGEFIDNVSEAAEEWLEENMDQERREQLLKNLENGYDESMPLQFQGATDTCERDSQCPSKCCIKLYQSEHFDDLSPEDQSKVMKVYMDTSFCMRDSHCLS